VYFPAEDIAITLEASLPEAVAQNNNASRCVSKSRFVFAEKPAEHGLDPQRLK
jgi:hypothetical protein